MSIKTLLIKGILKDKKKKLECFDTVTSNGRCLKD